MFKIMLTLIMITSYSNKHDQTDDTPNITANNRPVHSCGVATSRNLEDAGLKFGCRIHIGGVVNSNIRLDGTPYCNGLYAVNDRMHWRKWNQLDIFMFDNTKAIKFGRQKATVTLLWCE